MRLEQDTIGDLLRRLRQAQQQVHDIVAMLHAGDDLVQVAARLADVSRELDQVGFQIVATGLRQCAAAGAAGEDRTADVERIQRLFLSLG